MGEIQMNGLFNVIWEMAERLANKNEVGDFHALYAYSKLLVFDKSVIMTMAKVDDTEYEYCKQEVKSIFDKYGIDYQLIYKAVPVGLLIKKDLLGSDEACRKFRESKGSEGELSIQNFLELILEKNEKVVKKLFAKGLTMSEVYRILEGKTEAPQPEKPRVKASVIEQLIKPQETEEKQTDDMLKKPSNEVMPGNVFANRVQITRQLYSRLTEHVKGQDDAVRKFVQGYFESVIIRNQETNTKRPQATFLFAGPPGVGKTFLAESVAEPLGYAYKRFDMSEYSHENDVFEINGTQKSYKNPSEGKVTSFVNANPKSILLFDEIEKAHKRVIYLFLQILEGGVIFDNYNEKKVSFQDTILIFTTNVGKKLYEGEKDKNLSMMTKDAILSALIEETKENGEPAFPRELCSRFASGNIIMFNHLPMHHLVSITQKGFDKCVDMVKKEYGIELELDEKLPFAFLYNQGGMADARIASSKSISMIKQELYELGRALADEKVTDLTKVKKIKLTVGEYEDNEDTAYLFDNKDCGNVLVVSDREVNEAAIPRQNFHIVYAKNQKRMQELIKKQNFEAVFIDIMLDKVEQDVSYLSQGDIDSEGMRCFLSLRRKTPHIPVTVIANPHMTRQDEESFLQMGARDIIPLDENGKMDAQEIYRILENQYYQKCASDLASHGKVLDYSTAQYFSEDGENVVIRYYGFHLANSAYGDASKRLLAEEKRPKDRFDDVIGAENAKKDLGLFVKYLKNPRKYLEEGLDRPKGVLLYGPPGTGKTMLARAMAGESNVTFLSTSAVDFVGEHIGEGERIVKEYFETARRYAPSIIFIDEIDAIGKERTGEGNSVTERILNALLTEMDGFSVDVERPVFVLAATNFDLDGTTSGKRAVLDGALLRRFSNRIYVDLPNEEERKRYIVLMLTKKRRIELVSEDAIQNLAERTMGLSLSILKDIIDLAVRNAIEDEKPFSATYLLDAFENYQYGEEHKWDESYYRSVAFHEAGHAYLNWLSGETPSFVTIVSRGNFGGYMQPANQEKTPNYTKEDLIWKIRVALAGRASEMVNFGEAEGINTGVSSDLQNATNRALRMICNYGMLDNQLLSIDPEVLLRSSVADKILVQVNDLLNQQMEETLRLVKDGNDKITRLAEELLKKNQLVSKEIEAIFNEE